MLSLIEILKTKNLPLDNYKIHLATGKEYPPIDAFLEGKFKEWQEEQSNKNFECDYVLSLINIERDTWLFAGIYKILSVGKGTRASFRYNTQLLPNQDDLIGRAIIHYKREGRASYVWGHKYGKHLELVEIKPTPISIGDFPGYNKVILSHRQLKVIVGQQEPSWKSALSSVKGIYLISDILSGKLYIGSATGNDGLWQRWESYAKTGHGGNSELRELIQEKSIDYASNFQYSVLEIADTHSTDEFIIERETYWKKVLLSRQFGYNSN
ncbi:MAG: GIY-YIG nuclease family protein [Anaerolineae bacterium]|nr:GIY-YIG nuclease family protein [Anaerolineae bacterium]MBL8106446.1 GIY-YIG nuclease family protein [Anaerolineales bacterium]MCC7189913.1 GIY-YIG nuclease family protein [Anaerolineales bacterium]